MKYIQQVLHFLSIWCHVPGHLISNRIFDANRVVGKNKTADSHKLCMVCADKELVKKKPNYRVRYLGKAVLVISLSWFSMDCAPKLSTAGEAQYRNRFVHFTELSDYLKYQPGIRVRGSGRDTSVRLLRNSEFDDGPIFLLNGIPMGRNYVHVNDAIHMMAVRDIRIRKGLAERSSTGLVDPGGVIEIWTFATTW